MLWIITEDKLFSADYDEVSAVGKCVTHSAQRQTALRHAASDKERLALIESWKKECNFEFRLFSDDQEHYYSGVCLDLDQQDGESAFAPLEWARWTAGCTYMEYRKKSEKRWKVL